MERKTKERTDEKTECFKLATQSAQEEESTKSE